MHSKSNESGPQNHEPPVHDSSLPAMPRTPRLGHASLPVQRDPIDIADEQVLNWERVLQTACPDALEQMSPSLRSRCNASVATAVAGLGQASRQEKSEVELITAADFLRVCLETGGGEHFRRMAEELLAPKDPNRGVELAKLVEPDTRNSPLKVRVRLPKRTSSGAPAQGSRDVQSVVQSIEMSKAERLKRQEAQAHLERQRHRLIYEMDRMDNLKPQQQDRQNWRPPVD